jgi:hypothetical protein
VAFPPAPLQIKGGPHSSPCAGCPPPRTYSAMDPPLLAQANLGPKEPAREPSEQLQGLKITVQARLTNVQPWDAHVTRLTRHAPACEAIIDEINLLERLATLSRAFQAIHREFTGNWTARVLRRHSKYEMDYFHRPPHGGTRLGGAHGEIAGRQRTLHSGSDASYAKGVMGMGGHD